MNCIIIEDTKIISWGCAYYEIEEGQEVIKDYIKPWPLDKDDNKLPKHLCYWDSVNKEVKAKTPEMLIADDEKKIADDETAICGMLDKVLVDCNTFEDLKAKIISMV